MSEQFDCIVIGLGAMGSATCMHLARRQKRVLGLDQFGIGHALGSSGGESRIHRLCYYEHPDYVPLLRRAQELWIALERDAQRKLFYLTGGLYMGRPEGEFIAGSRRAAIQHALPHELLSHADLKRRFPMFSMPADFVGMLEPNAGAIMSEVAIAAHAELAMRAGAELRGHERVLNWESRGGSVVVATERARYEAESLVLAAGAWTSRVCADLGIRSQVARQVVGWLRPLDPAAFAPERLPVWAADDGEGFLHYGFPLLPGTPGVKMARHYPGQPIEVEAIDRDVSSRDVASIERIGHRVMPGAVGTLLGAKVCMYTNAPDSHFIIDRHPQHDNVFVACGFSGHGYKFATVVGEALADLCTRGATRHPVEFLSLRRFQEH